ncbi:MAG: NAD(P)H-dependent oxidoreductase [Hyalangium sp.]|uniref:NAD(P)H-dependent oxidoreductase n=1 Tax=Hyalangium sp. TaxID=2028555 RepID=UPI00389A5067
MPKRILTVLGHPNLESYCAALHEAFASGAESAGANVQRLRLSELSFDPILKKSKALQQPLEADLLKAQEQIRWAEHLVFVYPVWWGNCPALMQGFFDRALVQGFGFRYTDEQLFWDKLLTGRTAEVIATLNAPVWYYRWVLRDSGIRSLTGPTLAFCGIKTTRITRIGPIKHFKDTRRRRWLEKARQLGAAAAR